MHPVKWIERQIEWAKSFLSEPSGKGSSKRAMSVGVVVVFLIAYLRISLETQRMEDMPINWSLMIAGIIGLGILDKLVDNKRPPTGGTP